MEDDGLIEIPEYRLGDPVICEDPVTRRLISLAHNVARTPSTVLLSGESGVGKEVFARIIHDNSRRRSQTFVGVNCAALPPALLESELFGHEKGSFSGAHQRHIGLFERACGGTILLDEVSEMALELQAKLLRVLQERTMYRVGGREPIKLDVRVIATTNRNLKKAVADGDFRLDLYYRLNVFPLHIPSLRERRKDIEPLVMHFVRSFAEQLGRDIRAIERTALTRLLEYDYPGNVRELINILERAVILAEGDEVLRSHHIMLEQVSPLLETTRHHRDASGQKSAVRFVPGAEPLTDVRMKIILGTLAKFDGNRTRTAEALGVSVRTIRNKIRDYRERGVSVPENN